MYLSLPVELLGVQAFRQEGGRGIKYPEVVGQVVVEKPINERGWIEGRRC